VNEIIKTRSSFDYRFQPGQAVLVALLSSVPGKTVAQGWTSWSAHSFEGEPQGRRRAVAAAIALGIGFLLVLCLVASLLLADFGGIFDETEEKEDEVEH